MALADTTRDMVLDHILGTSAYTFDNTVFLALGSDTTPAHNVFTEITTAGTNGYARQAIVFNAAGSDGIAENAAGTLTFGPCSGSNWGTLKSFGIFSASTGGTRITQGPLADQTKVVNVGDSSTVAAGAITVTSA